MTDPIRVRRSRPGLSPAASLPSRADSLPTRRRKSPTRSSSEGSSPSRSPSTSRSSVRCARSSRSRSGADPGDRCRDGPVDRVGQARHRRGCDLPRHAPHRPGTRGLGGGPGVPTLPGAFTPTEVLAAWRAGAAAVKLFPASVAGPAFVRECHGPFPDVPLVPSGGVTAETAGDFIRAGAVAVGIGSWLVSDTEPTEVTARARQVVQAVTAARAGSPR